MHNKDEYFMEFNKSLQKKAGFEANIFVENLLLMGEIQSLEDIKNIKGNHNYG